MKHSLLKVTVCMATAMAAVTVLATDSDESSSAASSSSTNLWNDSSSRDSSINGQSSGMRTHEDLTPTGRTTGNSQQQVRASKLIGADVSSRQGDRIGTIEDVIFNSANGRADYAVISLSGSSTLSSGSASSASATSSTGMSGDKLYPVPWRLLKPGSAGASSSASATAGQVSFTLNTERSKVEQGPSFDRGSWPDVSTSDWRQRIFSHFGAAQSGMGGAEEPSGSSQSGSSQGSESGSPTESPAISSPPSSQSNP